MDTYKDSHTHFSGSLPLKFIWRSMRRQSLPLGEHAVTWRRLCPGLSYALCLTATGGEERDCFNHFTQNIKLAFGADYRQNLSTFFALYAMVQLWTKASTPEAMRRLYYQGSKVIAANFREQGVTHFEIIAGPMTEWDKTYTRIDNMIRGLLHEEIHGGAGLCGLIRLTFIADKSSRYANYSPEILARIGDMLERDHQWRDRIVGFDFSGVERVSNITKQREVIDQIRSINLRLSRRLLVSVHAGEDMAHNTTHDLLEYFEQLLGLDIDRICHGTFLWIPAHSIHLSAQDDQKRKCLLRKIAEKRIVLEICPTANQLLSPLKRCADIPLTEFTALGLQLSINTDNPSLFSTTLAEEYQKLGL